MTTARLKQIEEQAANMFGAYWWQEVGALDLAKWVENNPSEEVRAIIIALAYWDQPNVQKLEEFNNAVARAKEILEAMK